jgi:hypothetical protein
MSAAVIRLSDRRPARAPHPADVLSFMRRRPKGGGIDYWTVEASGNYGVDCRRGKELAMEFGAFLGREPTYGNASLLQCIVADMVRRPHVAAAGRLSGVEVAFLATVGRLAAEGARHLANA